MLARGRRDDGPPKKIIPFAVAIAFLLSGCAVMDGPFQDSPIEKIIDNQDAGKERKTNEDGNTLIRANDVDDLWNNLAADEKLAMCGLYRTDAAGLRRAFASVPAKQMNLTSLNNPNLALQTAEDLLRTFGLNST